MFLLHLVILSVCLSLPLCVSLPVCMCVSLCVSIPMPQQACQVHNQPAGVCSLLLPRVSWRSDSSHQAGQQAPCPQSHLAAPQVLYM